jgi:hypothetical protein
VQEKNKIFLQLLIANEKIKKIAISSALKGCFSSLKRITFEEESYR